MVLLGRKIKELRNKYRLTQTELATQIGVTKSTVAAYENGLKTEQLQMVENLIAHFRKSNAMEAMLKEYDSLK